jgi:integrase
MRVERLDAKTINGLDLPDGKDEEFFWDESLPGFGLRMRKSGGKSWVVQYRNRAGRTLKYTLGALKKIAPPEARKSAKGILGAVAVGGDPQNDKVQARLADVHTLRSVIDAYLAARKPELRPASFKVTKLYLTGAAYFGPLHRAAITAIGRADIASRLGTIAREVSPTTARQAFLALSGLYSWATGEGLVGNAVNPTIGVNVPAVPPPRERVLSDAELVAIWHGCEDDDFGRVVRLLIMLGSRRAEIGGLRWSELNLEAAAWLLPGARAKNKRAMLVPLPPAALEIINKVVPQEGRDCLFGERGAAGFTDWAPSKRRLDERLGSAVGTWRIHDIRRSVATKMGDLGILPHTVEAVLNHQSGHKRGVAGVYNRSPYEREVRSALLLWSEHVLALVEDREEKIVPMRA